MTKRLATPIEVSEHLQKPEATLRQWRWQGIGPPFIKVGRDVRYRWDDVEQWLDAHCDGTEARAR